MQEGPAAQAHIVNFLDADGNRVEKYEFVGPLFVLEGYIENRLRRSRKIKEACRYEPHDPDPCMMYKMTL